MSPSSRLPLHLRLLLAITWILILLAGYYWGHKPFDTATAGSLGLVLADLAIAALSIVLCGAVGRLVLPAPGLDGLERSLLQAAAGMGLLSLLWLVLGSLGLFHPAAAWVLLAGGLAGLYPSGFAWMQDLSAGLRVYRMAGRFDRLLLVFLGLLAGLQLLFALAPPLKYDALSYHLQLPRAYIQAGRLVFTPDNPYWGHPQLGEMLFTWMDLLGRPQTAALMGFSWGLLVLVGIAATTRRLVSLLAVNYEDQTHAHPPSSLTAGLVAAAVLMAGATFRWLFGWGYTDLLSALMGWAALTAVLVYLEQTPDVRENRSHWILWAGIFCGFAIGTKWTGALLPAGIFGALLLLRSRLGLSFKTLFGGAAFVIAGAAPWLLKNLLATGNLLYPYFLPTEWISFERLNAASGGDAGLPLWQTLMFPLSSTLFGWDSAPGFGADLGPLLALLALPGLWFARRHRFGLLLASPLALAWVVVVLGSPYFNHLQQPRLYFALLPAAGIAAGLGWAGFSCLRTPLLRLERLLAALLVLTLVFTTVQDLRRNLELGPARVLAGAETPQAFLERSLGMYALAMQALHELPPGSRTLMLWEARGMYAPADAAADPWIDRWRADYWRFGSAEAVHSAWLEAGFTHLLLYRSGMEAVRVDGGALEPEGWGALDALLASLRQPVKYGEVYELYPLVK